jgi:hypothetical protein
MAHYTSSFLKGFCLFVFQKLEAESDMPAIKQERLDDSCVPAGGARSLGSMQKVPSLSDLSDAESSLGEYIIRLIPLEFQKLKLIKNS